MKRKTRALLAGAVGAFLLGPSVASADELYILQMLGRVQGSGDPYSSTIDVAAGNTIDYQISISLAPTGTSNTQVNFTRTRDSGGSGEGANLVKFNLYQDATSNSAVDAVFSSGVTLASGWDVGTSAKVGTVSSGDLLTVCANLGATAGVSVGTIATGTFTIGAGASGTGYLNFGYWDPSYVTGGSTVVSGKIYGHTSSIATSSLLNVTATATYLSSVQGGTEASADPMVQLLGLTLNAAPSADSTTYTLTGLQGSTMNLLKGGTLDVATGSIITNTGGASADTLTYTGLSATSGNTGIATVIGTSDGGPLANNGGSATQAITIGGAGYGSTTITGSVSSATNTVLATAATLDNTPPQFTVNVGNATAGSGGRADVNFGAALAGQGAGGSYAGLASKVAVNSSVPGATEAIILAGIDSGTHTVTMKWRQRHNGDGINETTLLASDVVKIGGMALAGGQSHSGVAETDTYVLQMSFSDMVGGTPGDHPYWLASLSLGADGEVGGTGADADSWVSAVSLNFSGTEQWLGQMDVNTGVGTLGSEDLGKFGYYENGGIWYAWAVVNHDGQFAVVPLPPTYLAGLVGLAGLAGLQIRRRRR